MSVRQVIRMGHPVLREVGQKIPVQQIKSEETQKLIDDLIATMKHKNGLGIAATQIAVSKQVCIIQIPDNNPRYGNLKPYPQSVVINPQITIIDQQTQGFWQGCLSVPGIRGYVRRPRKIKASYYNQKGQHIQVQLENMAAVVFQHQVDHLNGVLFIDKAEPTKIAFVEQFEHFAIYKTQKVLDD